MFANPQTSVWDSKLSRENYHGTHTVTTAGDCQHSLWPFGTFKTDLPLAKTTKKNFIAVIGLKSAGLVTQKYSQEKYFLKELKDGC